MYAPNETYKLKRCDTKIMITTTQHQSTHNQLSIGWMQLRACTNNECLLHVRRLSPNTTSPKTLYQGHIQFSIIVALPCMFPSNLHARMSIGGN